MKALRWVLVVAAVYVGIVVLFESLLGYFQPQAETTLVITTTNEQGLAAERVLARLESGGAVFVAANHWPRAWYRQVLRNPDVKVTYGGSTWSARALPATAEEEARLASEHATGLMFRFLTGFPPRRFVRLDPVNEPQPAATAGSSAG